MIGWVTQLTPLEVQPEWGLTGQPVTRILDQVDTTGWVEGDEVEVVERGGQLAVSGRWVTP